MKAGTIDQVKISVELVLGRTELTVEELASLSEGSIVELTSLAGEPVELRAGGAVVASAEVVVIDENFGARITGLVSDESREKK